VNRRDTRVCWQVNKGGGLSKGWERGCVVVSDFIVMYNNAWFMKDELQYAYVMYI
jgi:hypothetical protein